MVSWTRRVWFSHSSSYLSSANRDGIHSVYTTYGNFEIMYHVAPCIKGDDHVCWILVASLTSQINRKRFVGNDPVVIVFLEAGATLPFNISAMPSRMNRVFIIVKALPLLHGYAIYPSQRLIFARQRRYEVSISRKQDVPQFGPALTYPPVYILNEEFYNLFMKICTSAFLCLLILAVINAQLAVDRSPVLGEKMGKPKLQAKAWGELQTKLKKKKVHIL